MSPRAGPRGRRRSAQTDQRAFEEYDPRNADRVELVGAGRQLHIRGRFGRCYRGQSVSALPDKPSRVPLPFLRGEGETQTRSKNDRSRIFSSLRTSLPQNIAGAQAAFRTQRQLRGAMRLARDKGHRTKEALDTSVTSSPVPMAIT